MIEVDGKTVSASGSVLDACREAGADVASFCKDERTTNRGHCRSCIVEVDGKMLASCTTPARDGMVVATESEGLRLYREDLAERMLAESAPSGVVGARLEAWGARGHRYWRNRDGRRGPAHTYLLVDPSACILCRRCITACAEIQGQFVFHPTGRGQESRLGWGEGLEESGCVSCGACVEACPTAAITDVDRVADAAAAERPQESIRTTCGYCGVGCQLEVSATADAILHVEGTKDAAVNAGHLCVKGRYAHAFVRHPDRLKTPLIRRDGELRPASWDEAYRYIAEAMARLEGRVAGLSSSRCTNEENYLLQKWFRAGLGTHDVDCCARICHAPTATGMKNAFGTGAATNAISDLELADLFLVAGSNTTESHPIVGARIRQRMLGGTPSIVIDPRRTELASLATVHLQLRPGTNVLLLNSLAAVLVEEDLVDLAFVEARVEGWSKYASFIVAFSPESTEEATGVPAALVRQAARMYGEAARPLQVHGLGMTEHIQGSEAVMLLCNLAMLVGALGREGVGVNPLRGQNNVQGAADMGCQPDAMTGYAPVADAGARARFSEVWGRELSSEPGRTLPKMYDAIRAGELRGLFIMGEDVVQTDADATRVVEALEELELLVVQEIFPSSTTPYAHVVLPGASFLEKDGTFTNGERRIQRVRKVLEPVGDARPDWRILCELMEATGFPQSFESPADVMDEIARMAPNFAGVSYARLDADGLQWPVPTAGHPGTTFLHEGSFTRGKAQLARVDFVPSPALGEAGAEHLLLITGRVLEHYNSGSMTRRTDNAKLVDGDRLELHPDDAAARGLTPGQRVEVLSSFGKAEASLEVTEDIAPGTAFLSFHFPETGTNRVTSDVLDRLADCPEYKVTAVRVSAMRDSEG